MLVAVTYATHEINWETAFKDSMAIYLEDWGHSNPKFEYKGSKKTACVSHQDGIFGVDFLDPDLKEQILVEVQEDGNLRHLSFFHEGEEIFTEDYCLKAKLFSCRTSEETGHALCRIFLNLLGDILYYSFTEFSGNDGCLIQGIQLSDQTGKMVVYRTVKSNYSFVFEFNFELPNKVTHVSN